MLLVAALASAETLTLTSAGPANDGVYDTGLYGLTVANPPAAPVAPRPILGLCLSAAVEINIGYSWQAALLSLTDYETVAGLTAQQGDELAYLWTQIVAAPTPAMSDAVWTIAGVPVNNAGASDVAFWVNQATLNYASIDPNRFQVWTPQNSSGSLDLTISQPFMVDALPPSPEPSTVMLAAGALLLIIARLIARRRKLTA
jgi:hypothetical protein